MTRDLNQITSGYTFGEEVANSITHGVGVVLSIVGLIVLLIYSIPHNTIWHTVGCSIFGATLLSLYLASTLYHGIPKVTWKRVLRTIDHSAIFLLIAGTYTPFLLIRLRGVWGWSLFGIVWGLAIAGVIIKVIYAARFHKLTVAIYIVMGWLVVVASQEMINRVAVQSLILLVAGGVLYTTGVIFYLWRRLPYNHAIWHVFVLTGSTFHYFAVLHIL